jgi:5-oxopent-3-ene-1,2,5-tricarboxylate decarboxylase/2-hydroxyhepta-2,4-diene-1,7-dioate isomerase
VLDTYDMVAFASGLITQEPGDVVLTGTPAGARQSIVRAGDRVVLEIEGLGALTNTIRQAHG